MHCADTYTVQMGTDSSKLWRSFRNYPASLCNEMTTRKSSMSDVTLNITARIRYHLMGRVIMRFGADIEQPTDVHL